jgi:CMP-2-keto-3-deoxyoctulosonic acid synthetase
VRGPSIDRRDLSLEDLGGQPLIDWTLDAALATSSLEKVVVTTPCERVQAHIRARWPQVLLAKRTIGSASENVGFEASVAQAVSQVAEEPPDAVLELTVQFPFREPFSIDKALDVMRIFPVSRVVSVLAEDDVFYQHTGGGLVPVGGTQRLKGLRLEREYLYRQAGGLMLRRFGTAVGDDQLGHVIVSKHAAFKVRDGGDLVTGAAIAAQLRVR